MSPIPSQRESDATAMANGAVMGLVVESLRRVEDSLGRLSENVTTQLARLPSDYVPRREVERRLDELTLDIGQERAERLAGIKEVCDDAAALRRHAEIARRWLIGTGITAIAAASAAAGVVINIIH